MRRLLTFGLGLGIAGLIAASCGSAASPAPPSGSTSAAPTAAAAASASASLSGSLVPSAHTSGVADLRTLLPDTIGGFTLTKTQVSGDQLTAGGAVTPDMQNLLSSIGRKPTDLTLAIAKDQSGTTDLNITAFRVRGTPVETFLQGYLPMLAKAFPNQSIAPGTLAGKPIYTVFAPSGRPSQVLVPRDDVLFVVISADAALVNEAVSSLP